MAIINAVGRSFQEASFTGIRSFDIGTDLHPVAELIAEAFSQELDPNGNAALREMRIMGYLGGFLKLLNRSTGEFNDLFSGFVWVENGQVQGNITVQRINSHGSLWQIANVVVAPRLRGRGIGSRLMDRALAHIDRVGGEWAVLQVKADNRVARNLYDRLAFEELGGYVRLCLRPETFQRYHGLKAARLYDLPPAEKIAGRIPHFRPYSAGHWRFVYDLANSQAGEQSKWWRPIRRQDFQSTLEEQIGEWFRKVIGRTTVLRRCIQVQDRFDAALLLTIRRWSGSHNCRIWVRPEHQGRFENMLVDWMLATLREYPRLPIEIDVGTDHTAIVDALQNAGFRPVYTLLTMRRKMRG